MIDFSKSVIDKISFRNKNFLVKRDDLISKEFSGNKARKLYYFLVNDFKESKIISYGSNQSNAMYSLSVLAKMKNKKFIYYTDHISNYLLKNPVGNFKYALQNGMDIRLGKPILEDDAIFIEEGGRVKEASFGIEILANEIKKQVSSDIKIFLPSGTGTTALFLQKYLKEYQVLTTPCVGDKDYLKYQFNQLSKDNHPTILPLPKKYHFGKLYKELFEIYLELKEQIEFDLLYDSIGWKCIEYNNLENILYIHQGGLIGNESMLSRYKRKFLC